jgi:DNA (cytosine-5)-methyltransferase 1
LFADENPVERPKTSIGKLAHGFYWTEGLSGLGWAVDSVPTLKNGSTLGIASPPAILLPDGRLVKPSLEDAEALQGFSRGWTTPAERVARKGYRWGLVGSAVTVPVAEWIGRRLNQPGKWGPLCEEAFPTHGKCPKAARFDGRSRRTVQIATDVLGLQAPHLTTFLSDPLEQLSVKAAHGFLSRTRRARLNFHPQFIAAVERHVLALGGRLPPYSGTLAAAA